MEGITKGDFRHPKRVSDYFEIKNIGDYHNLFIQSNKILLVDVFVNF